MENPNKEDLEIMEAAARHYGGPVTIVHKAEILHKGWEMDNYGWIIKLESGKLVAVTTSHGGLREWKKEDLKEAISETEASLSSLNNVLTWWPKE